MYSYKWVHIDKVNFNFKYLNVNCFYSSNSEDSEEKMRKGKCVLI